MANTQKSMQRKPRVHIEIDVDGDDGPKKVTLPMVIGVMSGLSGANQNPEVIGEVADRQFLEFDQQNFNERLSAMKPRVKMQVANKLGGQGKLDVDLTFSSMDDFSPAKIAENFKPLNTLLEARKNLSEAKVWAGNGRTRKKAVAAILKTLREDPAARKAVESAMKKFLPNDED